MKKERIAIFDLDGTIVNTDNANSAAYRVALSKAGIRNVTGVYGRMTANVIGMVVNGISQTGMDDIVRMKVEAYCKELWRCCLGSAAEAFHCVIVRRNMFDKIVLLTDSAERRAMETLRYYGLEHYFDEIVCNGGHGNKYENYFKVFDSDPAACVVWENEEGQIMSAIATGVKMENIRKVG